MKANVFGLLSVPCCVVDAPVCICGDEERILRAYVAATPGLPKMSSIQREWCLSQIDAIEGHARSDYQDLQDPDLARGVLDAWMDYCRDKGLL